MVSSRLVPSRFGKVSLPISQAIREYDLSHSRVGSVGVGVPVVSFGCPEQPRKDLLGVRYYQRLAESEYQEVFHW